MFTLSDIMFVNAETLDSLQIIQSEIHPNSHMQGPNKSTSGAKESLSIYGLFHHLASTSQGRQKLRRIFLRPSIDLSVIRERLNTTVTFLRPDNQSAVEMIVASLKKIKDMRSVVIHLQKGVCDVPRKSSSIKNGVWSSIQNFTCHTSNILEAMRELIDGGQLSEITLKVMPLSKTPVPSG
jgi:DNA mismatch repair protein MSH5